MEQKDRALNEMVADLARTADIEELLRQTDAVAEVHNPVRTGVGVALLPWTATPPTASL